MDFYSAFFNAFLQNWHYFSLFLVFALLTTFFKSNWFKGAAGEALVNFVADAKLDKATYHVIKNITLPTTNGGSTQIDHVIVSEFGIFVIETKNMKGWIFGSKNQPQWTQQIYQYKNQFQNPLRQNYKHIKVLQSYLNLPDDVFKSVIVFTGEANFKTTMPNNVIKAGQFIDFIHNHQIHKLTDVQVRMVIHTIDKTRKESSFKTHRDHVQQLKNRHQTRATTSPLADIDENKPTCPLCGNQMLLRTAKKGTNAGKKFWGCNQFPHCRGVRNI